MVGQNKLQKQFNNFTLNTLPHSMLFIGELGCGKHELCSLISNQFGLQLVQIDDKINYELIENLNNLVEPTLCIFNGKSITYKEEAILLKFIEEPHSNIYIAILCESIAFMLDTILNRCQIFRFEDYSIDELKSFMTSNNTDILKVATTPGKIKLWENAAFNDVYQYCNKIFEKIKCASLSNILNIVNKVNFDLDSLEKYEMTWFFAVLKYCAFERVLNNFPNATQQYQITNKFLNSLTIPHINKKQLFEHYLYELRGEIN